MSETVDANNGDRPLLQLSRVDSRGPAPVRIAHLGLGSFFRAHEAWYTDHAPDGDDWGIAAFTGRTPGLARALRAQQGLYTLVTRAPDADCHEVVGSVSAVHAGTEHAAWLKYASSAQLALVSLTVTEAAYCRDVTGQLDLGRTEVIGDIDALRTDLGHPVSTIPGRLVAGLAARRKSGAGALAIMSNDNLPHNGDVTRRVVDDFAIQVDGDLAHWIADNVSFVTTMVDRITPRTTDDDRQRMSTITGWADSEPVITEPFSEWVISGEFPCGRPTWEASGARFVADVSVFEKRKLWLLNGSHSLLAYAGSARGHQTVAEAIADPICRGWVENWWAEASDHLGMPAADVAAYRSDLLARFMNGRMRHLLGQIAQDGSQKLPVRIVPVLRAERAARRMPRGAVLTLGAWLAHLRGHGAPVMDPAARFLRSRVQGDLDEAAVHVMAAVAPELIDDVAITAAVANAAAAVIQLAVPAVASILE